jgi:hypothetical protein
LLKNPTSILEIPRDSILYQGISVTVHYPKQKCWTQEIIQYLKSYSAAQDQHGILVGVSSWRDTVQSSMEAIVDGKEHGRWNWDHNHRLGNKKMYPAPWPIDIRRVYKNLCEGNPAGDIIIGEICKTNEEERKAVGKDKEITDKWVEEQLTTIHLTDCSTVHEIEGPQDRIPPPDVPNRIISMQGKFTAIQFDQSSQLPSHHHVRLLGLGELQKNPASFRGCVTLQNADR